MAKVFIGVDPHKLSATIEVVDHRETILATGRFATDKVGYAAMRRHVAAWPDRTWAVEGSNGAGRPLAQRLLADGEQVVDVPAKLSARARLFDTGHNRKTDAHDAHAVAVVAVRTRNLRVLSYDDELEALRMLVDRRDELARQRVQTVNRLQRLLSELVPGKAKKDITALQAKAILAGVRPRDVAGKTRRRLVVEQLTDLFTIDKKIKASTKELKAMVLARGSRLMDLPGVGPVVAARILADVGDVARFADRNRFASWTGTAPLDASSGEQIRHRLSRAGNRKMNHVLHIAAATQVRLDTKGRAYYRRKLAAGKTRMGAMRCLKRRISDGVYRQLVADARRTSDLELVERPGTGPGGHSGASHQSSAVDLPPHIDTSDQPLPGPAPQTLPGTKPGAKPSAGSAPRPSRRRAGAVNVERPTGRTTLTATSAGAHSKAPKPRP
jgi:transposase